MKLGAGLMWKMVEVGGCRMMFLPPTRAAPCCSDLKYTCMFFRLPPTPSLALHMTPSHMAFSTEPRLSSRPSARWCSRAPPPTGNPCLGGSVLGESGVAHRHGRFGAPRVTKPVMMHKLHKCPKVILAYFSYRCCTFAVNNM